MMSNVGQNRVSEHKNNPYFDGIISPITTQGEITLNCRVESAEVVQRKSNMTNETRRAMSYPGGDVDDNLSVMPNELVFGWTQKQGLNHVPGYPSHVAFSTLNGVRHAAYGSDDERLQLAINFIGLAKTPYVVGSPSQLKHGFAAIAVGSGTTFHTGELDIFPGQILQWSVVPTRKGAGTRGDPSSAGTNRIGTPKGKLRFRVNPVNGFNMRPSLNTALRMLRISSQNGGVNDFKYADVLAGDKTKSMPNALQEYALHLYHVRVVQAIRAAKEMQRQNVDLTQPDLEVARVAGLFDNVISEDSVAMKVMQAMYPMAPVTSSPKTMAQFRGEYPDAYGGGNKMKSPSSSDDATKRAVQFAMVSLGAGELDARAYALAFHVQARRCFAKSTCFSRPGQRLDLVIGHFLMSV